MLRSILLTALLSFTALTATAQELHFGDTVDSSKLVKISTLMETPNQYIGETITVEGTIIGVCEKRGCWVDLASDARFEKLRIKVKDGDMVFPLTAKGRTALATGELVEIQLDLEQTRAHQALLAERTGQQINAASIREPMSIYQLVPTGVTILE
ncbi:DUF4920 domain-containing protein [Shewanella sp. WXL01]|uniref:DUF4920 domain-containing protein n=1 Tax=Shewanella sp. WXL01 TaxID=2709721 RepID=UPI00143855FE|nr:DUF4920 domain-containing protein [Shewanella sp. WXL01]NKF49130.1 DUF4920 domain-containing protein [Shewanella sp. WXL01]